MHLGGTSKALEHMKEHHPKQASYCTMYLTFAYWSMVMGMIVGTFHSTSPFPMFFSGLGAWQAGLFRLAPFHLQTGQFHESVEDAELCMTVASALMTFYWADAVQDPLPLHSLVKGLMGILFLLWEIICWAVCLLVTVLSNWFTEKFGKAKSPCGSYLPFGQRLRAD